MKYTLCVTQQCNLACDYCYVGKCEETMPLDACQWFYECTGCGALLKPRRGDCCVFCSWGSVPCPPVQLNGRSGCC